MGSFSGNDNDFDFGADFQSAGSNNSNDFEYGDDSVAGEYEVKESTIFPYGVGEVHETIGAYYGNEKRKGTNDEPHIETRQDRYAKETLGEEDVYGYESVPEPEETIPVTEKSIPDTENTVKETVGTTSGKEAQNSDDSLWTRQESLSSILSIKPQEESQIEAETSDEADSNKQQEAFGIENIAPENEEINNDNTDKAESDNWSFIFPNMPENKNDRDVSVFGKTVYDGRELDNLNITPLNRRSSHRVRMATWSIVVCSIALLGISGICGLAIYRDNLKASSKGTGYSAPTTKSEVTTSSGETSEESSEASDTPTPTPEITATPTPEPTETPTPTPTAAPKKTQVYWVPPKKATSTPTPTPVPSNENNSENGSGNGSTNEGNTDNGEGNNGNNNSGNNQENSGNNNSNEGGNSQDNTGNNNSGNENNQNSDSGNNNTNSQDNNTNSNPEPNP